MTRAVWKGPFFDRQILKQWRVVKRQNYRLYGKKRRFKLLKRVLYRWVFIRSRRSVIPAFFIGRKVCVYTGKAYKRFIVTERHVGHKFGEFVGTRYRRREKRAKNRNKK
jgi:ribosomal protein S19